MGNLYDRDVDELVHSTVVPWDELDGARVVITGATGLIGGLAARVCLARAGVATRPVELVCLVRNVEKARAQLGTSDHLRLVPWDAMQGQVPQELDSCDYILHCASNTNSQLMVERPVDTIFTTVDGTKAMLDLACRTRARMCFVSSMEVYGAGGSIPLRESRGGELDAMNVRSSYPQAKQMAETLCASYAAQYGVSVCVARLAQSFGPGIASTDRRVFAEFARCCREGRDIQLLTDGSKSNMYVYTADAVSALLLLLVRGVRGEAYNVANEETSCSIWEMANAVADVFGTSTNVERIVDEEAVKRYAVSGCLRLDTSKIRRLGWLPTTGLMSMYERMIDDWE